MLRPYKDRDRTGGLLDILALQQMRSLNYPNFSQQTNAPTKHQIQSSVSCGTGILPVLH
ncbi:MAG: hypothetical protein F6K31_10845 [Symploca sp. SIO2G7]|nr:hypothetical protein [Symploca sp. SIO2G7]